MGKTDPLKTTSTPISSPTNSSARFKTRTAAAAAMAIPANAAAVVASKTTTSPIQLACRRSRPMPRGDDHEVDERTRYGKRERKADQAETELACRDRMARERLERPCELFLAQTRHELDASARDHSRHEDAGSWRTRSSSAHR